MLLRPGRQHERRQMRLSAASLDARAAFPVVKLADRWCGASPPILSQSVRRVTEALIQLWIWYIGIDLSAAMSIPRSARRPPSSRRCS